MQNPEYAQDPIWVDRDLKRRSLTIIDQVQNLPSLSGEQSFAHFVFDDQEEREISDFSKEQIFTLISILRGADLQGDYEELVKGHGVDGSKVSPDWAIEPLKGDYRKFKLSSFYQGRLVTQAIYDKAYNRFPFFSELIYYQDIEGKEKAVEVNHDELSGHSYEDKETYYTSPFDQKKIINPKTRDAQNLFYLLLNSRDKNLYRQDIGQEYGYSTLRRSAYEDGSEISREVIYNDKLRNAVAYYVISLASANTVNAMVIRKNLIELKEDKQWVFCVDSVEKMNYNHLLKHLLTQDHNPEWDSELSLALELKNIKGRMIAKIDNEWVEETQTVDSNGHPTSDDHQAVFQDRAGVLLRVYFDEMGHTENLAIESDYSNSSQN